METLVGKSLKNEKDEDYIVLSEFTVKEIPCVYAMKLETDEKEGEKGFFQITGVENPSLVNIKSKKLLKSLNDALFEQVKGEDKPRKIKEDESIQDYLAYLDEFYKSKVVTVM